MNNIHIFRLTVIALAGIISVLALPGCSSSGTSNVPPATNNTNSSPPGIGHTVINSDSFITGEIRSIEKQTTGYPTSLGVFVDLADSVGDLPNAAADQVGKVMTAVTDEDVSALSVGQSITAHVKYVGDVPQPGISLYIFNIQPVAATQTYMLNQEFTLGIAQSAMVQGEDMTVTFVDLTADSRCPQDATCIWAGEATASVKITKSGQSYDVMLTQPGGSDQNAVQDFGTYQLLFRVQPSPKTGTDIAKEDYRLVMTVANASPKPEIKISPAPIDDAKVAVTFSDPKEIIVWIKGGLSDTCTSFSDMSMTQSGTTITIKVNVQKVTNQICGYVYTFFERAMNLGSDFTSGQNYTVMVNDKTLTFTMP